MAARHQALPTSAQQSCSERLLPPSVHNRSLPRALDGSLPCAIKLPHLEHQLRHLLFINIFQITLIPIAPGSETFPIKRLLPCACFPNLDLIRVLTDDPPGSGHICTGR